MKGQDRRNRLYHVRQFLSGKIESINIGHLLLILLALHLFAMSFPSDGKPSPNMTGRVFDEYYYVPASENLLNFTASNLEHPFFGKIWGAIGIYLFGDDFFGWRIFYVVIGVLAVWVFYELARLFFSKEKSLFAASLLGFETLFFIHTSLLLLEGPPILFALIGFLCYFKKRYYLSALAFGLSVLSKEWGIYFVAALFFYHLYATRRVPFAKLFDREGLRHFVIFGVILFLTVALPLWAYDLVYKPVVNGVLFTNPFQNFDYYYSYHSSLTISPSDKLNTWDHYAWGWILPYHINPATYYQLTVTVGSGNNVSHYHPIDWLGIGNLVIWYSIWVIVPLIIGKAVTGNGTRLDAFIASWIGCTYAPSLILSGIFHRVVYAFYFVNVDPALALGIPMVIAFIAPDSLKLQRILMVFWLGAAIIFFILFFPVHPLDFAH